MCGIVGIWNRKRKEPVSTEMLGKMISVVRHRGPDDIGIYQSGDIGLGHARLSIVDLAGGHQPMTNEDGSLWVVFNGEIYNHPELRAGLVKKGHVFKTSSDTEVILHQYEELGEECVSTFNGQFAFALWDTKTRKLFLARDRMGVRPLYYTEHQGRFFFASEIKSIFADESIPRALDPFALDQIFTFWFPIAPRTGFQSIMELAPGHTLSVSENGIHARRYWRLNYPLNNKSSLPEPSREREYADELIALLDDAVRIRLRADVPVGAYLSGGLDSSIITALAVRHIHDQLKTFSIAFEDESFDETTPQSKVVSHLATEHCRFFCRTSEVGLGFESALWHTERPVLRTAPVPMMFLSGGVKQSGIKVVLTGEGADEILAGYDIFKEAKIRRFWAQIPGSRIRPQLLRRLYPYMPGIQTQTPAYIKAFFGQGLTDTVDPFYSHRLRWHVTSGLKRLYSEDMKERLKGYDAIADLREELPMEFSEWDSLCQAQYLEAAYLLPGYILSSQGDRMGMANSVEGRFPFLDHRVVEFACQIPSYLKLKGLREKHILREGANNLLPPGVLNRTKQPYRSPDHLAFFPNGKPQDAVEKTLSIRNIETAGIFSKNSVENLILKAKRPKALGTAEGMALTGLLSVQLLFDQFVGGKNLVEPKQHTVE
jgi:asparagine synthase (glutamine-hydrolysing)